LTIETSALCLILGKVLKHGFMRKSGLLPFVKIPHAVMNATPFINGLAPEVASQPA
jgi:hypothetical protein